MSQIKEWEYVYHTKICTGIHHNHSLSLLLNCNDEFMRRSAWLRLMGLMETWDITETWNMTE